MSESKVLDRRNLPIFIHSVIDDLQLSPNAFRVYAHLARRADKTGAAWPSYQSIGDHCFGMVFENPVTRRARARQAIDELIAAGLIRKTNRATDAGNTSNIYELLDPVPNRHTPVPIGTPMPNSDTPVPIDTDVPISHQRYSIEGTPFEDTPVKDSSSPPPVPADADWKTVCHAYESNIGSFTSMSSEMVHAAYVEYGATVIVEAIKEAVAHNKRKWAYVDSILQNWRANGRADRIRKEGEPKVKKQYVIKDTLTGERKVVTI